MRSTAEKIKGGLLSTAARACGRGATPAQRWCRETRRKLADHGDPLPGRLTPDAPQDQAARRGHRRLREVGQDGCARPARRHGRRDGGQAASTSRRAGSSGRSSRPGAVKPPAVKDTAWPRSDIDRFLLAALEAKGFKPVADAGQAHLDPPGQLRPDRPAADAGGDRSVRRRYCRMPLRESRRPAAGVAAVRRALGAALARRRAVRRVERQRPT